jgi:hypothetical protein
MCPQCVDDTRLSIFGRVAVAELTGRHGHATAIAAGAVVVD